MPVSVASLSCPYLCPVWLHKKAAGFPCGSALGMLPRCGRVLLVLLLHVKVAISEPEVRERAKSCDFRARVARNFCTAKLAIFQSELRECALRNIVVLKSSELRAAAGARPLRATLY